MNVLLFARAKDLMGSDRVEVDVPELATVGELRRRLMQRYPHLAGLLEKSAFAVNDEFSDDTARIPVDAEVALLPPVSGG
jgi:molybdopterin converting factor subunit 1